MSMQHAELLKLIRIQGGHLHFPTVDQGQDLEGAGVALYAISRLDRFGIGNDLVEMLIYFEYLSGAVTVRQCVADVIVPIIDVSIKANEKRAGETEGAH